MDALSGGALTFADAKALSTSRSVDSYGTDYEGFLWRSIVIYKLRICLLRWQQILIASTPAKVSGVPAIVSRYFREINPLTFAGYPNRMR